MRAQSEATIVNSGGSGIPSCRDGTDDDFESVDGALEKRLAMGSGSSTEESIELNSWMRTKLLFASQKYQTRIAQYRCSGAGMERYNAQLICDLMLAL